MIYLFLHAVKIIRGIRKTDVLFLFVAESWEICYDNCIFQKRGDAWKVRILRKV